MTVSRSDSRARINLLALVSLFNVAYSAAFDIATDSTATLTCTSIGVGNLSLTATVSNPDGLSVSYYWQFTINGAIVSTAQASTPDYLLQYNYLTSNGFSPDQSSTVVSTVNAVDSSTSSSLGAASAVVIIEDSCSQVIVSGDPHFLGAHGTHFDFNGELGHTYCLVTDKGIHINGRLKGYTSDATVGATMNNAGMGTRSWLGELGLIWTESATGKTHTLHLVARDGIGSRRQDGFIASAVYDGRELTIPSSPAVLASEEGSMMLSFLSTRRRTLYDVDRLRFSLKDRLDLIIDVLPAVPRFQLPDNSQVHFDLSQNFFKPSPKVHGILGQTYQSSPIRLFRAAKYQLLGRLTGEAVKADGASGYGFLDGKVEDYETSGVLQPDCKMSALV